VYDSTRKAFLQARVIVWLYACYILPVLGYFEICVLDVLPILSSIHSLVHSPSQKHGEDNSHETVKTHSTLSSVAVSSYSFRSSAITSSSSASSESLSSSFGSGMPLHSR
jgi:hypothetical protein